jgi:nifR3 family TIM-barrel protein
MHIGTLKLQNNVILAPMAGITDLPYRQVMKRLGAGLVFTEMVSANGLIRSGKRTRELLRSCAEERPLGVQLFGDDPELLAAATAEVGDAGELIDINMGCPVNKVIRSGAGSALLRQTRKIARIVAAVRRATDLPLTVKIRSGWDLQSVNYLEVGRIAEAEGVDAVTLHPRSRSQGFGGRADWEQIGRLKEALSVPVIGSGDIFTARDAMEMLEQTGCDAVMVGRGGYGNPWLIRNILALQAGRPETSPTCGERLEMALLHLDLFLLSFKAAKAIFEMRKHLCWYSRGLPGAAVFRSRINRCDSVEELRETTRRFFSSTGGTESPA